MKALKNLLRLDFLKLYSMGGWTIAYAALLFCLIADARTASLGFIILAYAAIYVPMAYDEQSKGGYLLCTLPVTRREIVRAKYLYALLLIVLSILAMAVATSLATTISGGLILSALPLLPVLSIFGSGYIALVLPLVLYLGVTKSRILVMGLYALSICGTTFYSSIYRDMDIALPHISALTVALVVAVLLVISYLVAVRLYERREFTE